MIGLDEIVVDPRFAPYHGWHDSYLSEEQARGKTGPAIQQIRSEYHEFLEHMQELGLTGGSCLQIGLGIPGASHVCLSKFFPDTWTLDINRAFIEDHMSRIVESRLSNKIVWGSSFDLSTIRFFAGREFNLLFIDGDHTYGAVEQDFNNFFPLVRSGGVVAFHDTVHYEYYDHNIQVGPFVDTLRDHFEVQDIGKILGISYLIKPSYP